MPSLRKKRGRGGRRANAGRKPKTACRADGSSVRQVKHYGPVKANGLRNENGAYKRKRKKVQELTAEARCATVIGISTRLYIILHAAKREAVVLEAELTTTVAVHRSSRRSWASAAWTRW